VGKRTGPDYQRVVDDLKSKISSGELKIGESIPSTPKLEEQYGVSNTVARRAVLELQNEGVLRGHPGKGVYVEAVPEESVTVRALHEELGVLREKYKELADTVGKLQAHLMDLYARVAEKYPEDNSGTKPARRRKTGT
jgi:GntR family transcriptional regulator